MAGKPRGKGHAFPRGFSFGDAVLIGYTAAMSRKSIKYSFDNGRGERLAAILDTPVDPPRLYGVFGPCFTCPKESHGAAKICRALAERGIAMLRFDTTGFGASEGDGRATNFTTRVADLKAAAAFVAGEFAAPRLLIGHSMSGTAALAAVKDIPSVELLATVGSPADPAHTIAKFREQNGITTRDDGLIDIMVINHKVTFRPEFIEDMLAQQLPAETAALTPQVFAFHAPNDNIVDFREAEEIARAAPRGTLVALDAEATHLFETRAADAEFIADKISGWFA